MKQSIFLAILIWGSFGVSANSRFREYTSCSVQDSFNGKDITINYTVEHGEDCNSSVPTELACRVLTPFLDIDASTCFKRSIAKLPVKTDHGRQINMISGIFKLNTPECSAASIPEELLNDILCKSIGEFQRDNEMLKLIKSWEIHKIYKEGL